MKNSFLEKERPLESLTEEEFYELKETGMLWELYPDAPERYWKE
jgi:hypothetical protein